MKIPDEKSATGWAAGMGEAPHTASVHFFGVTNVASDTGLRINVASVLKKIFLCFALGYIPYP